MNVGINGNCACLNLCDSFASALYLLQRFAAQHKADLEELAPKPEGHAALLEKRRQKGSYARDTKDATLDDIPDKDLMGSSGNEYQEMSECTTNGSRD